MGKTASKTPTGHPCASAPSRDSSDWLTGLPRRLWFLLCVLTAPLRLLAWLLDAAVAACALTVVATGWAFWTGRITDEQVALVLGQLGQRAINILQKSGVF